MKWLPAALPCNTIVTFRHWSFCNPQRDNFHDITRGSWTIPSVSLSYDSVYPLTYAIVYTES